VLRSGSGASILAPAPSAQHLQKKDSPVTFPKSITREKMKFQAQELSGAQIFSC
jgi:hypothetical protein